MTTTTTTTMATAGAISNTTKTIYSTSIEVDDAFYTLGATFATGLTKDLAWRRWQLKQLWWLVEENTDRFVDALKADLSRHPMETLSSEIMGLKADILSHLKNLEKWTSDEPYTTVFPLGTRLFRARLRKEPLGVALIMGAWNFPILLLLQPLVSAVAAGCCVLLKPSDLSGHSERLLCELVPKYLDPRAVRIVTGGPAETGYILEKPFNHIFFTGSSKIARIVAAAAAKNLTPVVLELGGQGPAIVHKSADVDHAARRIAAAKFQNAGQICLTVNHVFVDPEVADEFIDRVAHWCGQFLAGDGKQQMSRIINERNFDRLCGLVDASSGKIAYGGDRDRRDRYMQPTVVRDVTMTDSLLSEELFGPILPVITATPDEAIKAINSLPSPLALYLFSRDDGFVEKALDRTLSGGVTVNNVFFHIALGDAPFGGVGESGYGSYHGRHGVDCFSHRRAVLETPTWLDKLIGFTYAPYKMENLDKVMVKNSLGFKKGETMEDQRRRGGSATAWYLAAVLGLGGVLAAIGAGSLQW